MMKIRKYSKWGKEEKSYTAKIYSVKTFIIRLFYSLMFVAYFTLPVIYTNIVFKPCECSFAECQHQVPYIFVLILASTILAAITGLIYACGEFFKNCISNWFYWLLGGDLVEEFVKL